MCKKLILALAFLLPSCSTNMISVEALEPALSPVIQRHDAYVADDPALSEDEKEIFLRTTELLRRLLEEAGR